MEKRQVQEAISRIDQAVAQLTVNRHVHVALVNDIKLIQQCCTEYFGRVEWPQESEPKDGRTNIIPFSPEPDDEGCEGSGDSV